MGTSRKLFGIFVALLLILMIVCTVYVNDFYEADTAALTALVSDNTVTIEQTGNMLSFIPKSPTVGLIFYPGGKVEHTAYAPLMRMLAEKGYLCVLVEMPLNLAVLDVNAAADVPERYPDIEEWYIGGHSLGGSMAASYAADHASELEGLVLLAAYSTADLNETDLKIISIYGSEDGVLNMEKYSQNTSNLPPAYQEYIISGGCHGYFGSYGMQKGDGIPSISAEEQITKTTDLLTGLFS